MKQWLNLTKHEMNHLKDSKISTKKEFWHMREAQKVTVGDEFPQQPCWDCYIIEKQLKQVVKLFDLEKGDRFKTSLTGKEWTVHSVQMLNSKKDGIITESDGGAWKGYRREDNKDVIKVER